MNVIKSDGYVIEKRKQEWYIKHLSPDEIFMKLYTDLDGVPSAPYFEN